MFLIPLSATMWPSVTLVYNCSSLLGLLCFSDVSLFRRLSTNYLQLLLLYTGMAGLAVTYGLNLNARLSRWILSFCKLENKIISIERIHQYCQIPSEALPIIENCRPPPSWPENGTIELIDLKVLCFSYPDIYWILFFLIQNWVILHSPLSKAFSIQTANVITYEQDFHLWWPLHVDVPICPSKTLWGPWTPP